MKRRTFGLLAGTSIAALRTGFAKAQTAKDPSLLQTTLTPMGSERAGSADGSIPAWTGGYTTLPAGWQLGDFVPDPFSGEQPVVVIDSSNMAQYADKLTPGVQTMMTKYGFSIKVYPTHRTQSIPGWVAANVASNVTTAQLSPQGPQWGFSGAYGGYPFPIPDISDPSVAGAQIIYNHENYWQGQDYVCRESGWVINNGTPTMTNTTIVRWKIPYYQQSGSVATFNGTAGELLSELYEPPNENGEDVIQKQYTNSAKNPTMVWELLNGEGRVRIAPNLAFDTPAPFNDGLMDQDEYYSFQGSLQEYDWKYIEKKEMYIPYNTNALCGVSAQSVMKPHFIDPEGVRWELHRVWVVEAHLRAGERNTLPLRRYYVDEDSWLIGLGEVYDADNVMNRVGFLYPIIRPDLPGVFFVTTVVNNLLTDDYVIVNGIWDEEKSPSLKFNINMPDSTWDPENMAASGQY